MGFGRRKGILNLFSCFKTNDLEQGHFLAISVDDNSLFKYKCSRNCLFVKGLRKKNLRFLVTCASSTSVTLAEPIKFTNI